MRKKISTENQATATKESIVFPPATGTVKKKIDKLTIQFPNEDLNKLVEKVNEIIESHDTL